MGNLLLRQLEYTIFYIRFLHTQLSHIKMHLFLSLLEPAGICCSWIEIDLSAWKARLFTRISFSICVWQLHTYVSRSSYIVWHAATRFLCCHIFFVFVFHIVLLSFSFCISSYTIQTVFFFAFFAYLNLICAWSMRNLATKSLK